MPRKKKHEEKKTPKKKEEEREYNPFSSIVLKEKKEPEKKKAPVVSKPKKPGEIVQGYVPQLRPEEGQVEIVLPCFKRKDIRTYNYLPPRAAILSAGVYS